MKTLKQIYGHVKWVKPKRDSEHGEIYTQLNMLSQHPKIEHLPDDVHHEMKRLQNIKEYDHAIKHGKVKKIKPEKTHKILNHTSSPDSWGGLDADKKKNILHHFAKGKVEMPIILRNKKSRQKWLLAGNTRLTFNSQMRKEKTPCLMVDY